MSAIKRRNFWLSLSICSLAVIPALGQHQHHGDQVRAATLLSGLGNHHHPVSTRSPEAQRFFDQGLALIYAFNHDEAARSFRRAAELDPALGMAFWGLALAVGPNYNEAQVDPERVKAAVDAVGRARSLAARAPEAERAYIEALAARFSPDPGADFKRLARAYADAMKELARRHPDDLDAQTLYADALMSLRPWQLWGKDGRPAEGTEEVVAVLEGVLRRDPEHLGANHLYIHAVEASPTPERALPSAGRLGRLAPKAGHLVHMPAHIYIRTGDYEAAARSNVEAAAADREYIAATRAEGMYPMMYYSHNLHFLVESYNRLGRPGAARRAAGDLAANVRPHVKGMPMIEGFLSSPVFVMLRFGQWTEILSEPEPARELAVTGVFWRYARGVALAATGKLSEARREQEVFAAAAAGLSGETPFGLNSAASVLSVAGHALEARLARAAGDRGAEVAAWRRAAAAQAALNYDEPPGWYYPVRESLGGALLRAGEAAAAEQVFREDLTENPRNGRSLFGLTESLKAQGKKEAAQLVEREFKEAWKGAEVELKVEDL